MRHDLLLLESDVYANCRMGRDYALICTHQQGFFYCAFRPSQHLDTQITARKQHMSHGTGPGHNNMLFMSHSTRPRNHTGRNDMHETSGHGQFQKEIIEKRTGIGHRSLAE